MPVVALARARAGLALAGVALPRVAGLAVFVVRRAVVAALARPVVLAFAAALVVRRAVAVLARDPALVAEPVAAAARLLLLLPFFAVTVRSGSGEQVKQRSRSRPI